MKYVYLLITMLFIAAVFPYVFKKELTINVSIPEHMSSHEAKMIMDPIYSFFYGLNIKTPHG